jgi:hypothetical protein
MMVGSDPFAHFARIIAMGRQKPRCGLAMLWAYFDETAVNIAETPGGKMRPTEMFVGGCVATAEHWQKFTPKWSRALVKAGVSAFHAKDFYSFQGEFKWFDRNNNRDLRRHDKFRDSLADLILNHVDELIVFTSMAPIKERGTRKAYQDAALRAFYDATKFRTTDADSIYIVLARHPELSPWSILKKFEQINWEQKLAGCGIFQPNDVLPLQAADFVLHAVNRAWGAYKLPH